MRDAAWREAHTRADRVAENRNGLNPQGEMPEVDGANRKWVGGRMPQCERTNVGWNLAIFDGIDPLDRIMARMECGGLLRSHRIRSREEHGIGIVILLRLRLLLCRNGFAMVATTAVVLVLNVEVLGVAVAGRHVAAMRMIQQSGLGEQQTRQHKDRNQTANHSIPTGFPSVTV